MKSFGLFLHADVIVGALFRPGWEYEQFPRISYEIVREAYSTVESTDECDLLRLLRPPLSVFLRRTGVLEGLTLMMKNGSMEK